jgi:MFS family permease
MGRLSDTLHPRITITMGFIFRGIICSLFVWMGQPGSLFSYIAIILLMIASIMQNVSVDSIFAKNLPKETRGILNGCLSFGDQLAILLFTFVSGWMFDKVGPKSPIALIGVLDMLFFFGVLLAGRGLFHKHELLTEYHDLKETHGHAGVMELAKIED